MAQPLVSIITPSFNQADFIEDTLRSVLWQDYPRIEYLVVDGGSSDGSPEIIQRYADRLAWWVSEKDKGQADGINKGFRHATGEIVRMLSAGQSWHWSSIRKLAWSMVTG
jgi:glycosyltransferase involved in cell wall biosynthesis